jgi:hypothetical protein
VHGGFVPAAKGGFVAGGFVGDGAVVEASLIVDPNASVRAPGIERHGKPHTKNGSSMLWMEFSHHSRT